MKKKTNTKELKKVKRIFRNKTNEWLHLTIKTKYKEEEIICTKNHRIYINNKGWIEAKDILESDEVLLYNNVKGEVIKKELQILDHYETTYNFEVEDNHNYYVSDSCVLVHNECGKINSEVPDDYTPTYKNGVYENNPKHGMVQRGKISSKISSSKYGQYALDNAIRYPGGGKALYTYDGKYVYQFMPSNSSNTIYHGFITDFSGINNSKARNWLFHKFK